MKIKYVAGLCALWSVMHVAPVAAVSVEEQCEIVGEVAAVVMHSRQNGAAKEAVLAEVQVKGEPAITELFEVIVQEAYGEEIEEISRRRNAPISEFATYWQTTCLQKLSAL